MSDEYSYLVTVTFVTGEKIEFYAGSSFESIGEGMICMWNIAKVDNESLEFYCIPTAQIKDIRERYLGE